MVSSRWLFRRWCKKDEELLTDTYSEPWRLPFGDEKILDFYLDLLAADEIERNWTSDALRLVGNSCADLGSYRNKVHHFIVTDLSFKTSTESVHLPS